VTTAGLEVKDYSAIAVDYDRTRYGRHAARFLASRETEVLRRALRDYVAERGVLIDIACGTGYFTTRISDLFKHVIAVDASHAMLDVARSEGRLGRHVGAVQADAQRLPFRPGSADAVVSTRFVHLFPRQQHPMVLRFLLTPLRRGGILVVEHDSPSLEWRGRTQRSFNHSYDARETPAGVRRLAVRGVSGPLLGRLSTYAPHLAARLSWWYERQPLSVLAPHLIVVYRKEIDAC
jgi:ubiquinone/menaquinone biosynthesis C-methylase UbiE